VTERVGALLLAIGPAPEAASDGPWARLRGRPVLSWTLRTLAYSPLISRVALVVSDQLSRARRLAAGLDSVAVLRAGAYRAGLAAGLGELADCGWLVLHDTARPLVDDRLLRRGLQAAGATGAAVAVLEAGETVKRVADGAVSETLPRHELRSVQSPLILRSQLLRSALNDHEIDLCDLAGLLAHLAGRLAIFDGSPDNRKPAAPSDLEVPKRLPASERTIPRRAPLPPNFGRSELTTPRGQGGRRRAAR